MTLLFLFCVLYRKPAGKFCCENSSCSGVASCLIVSVPHAHGIVPRLSVLSVGFAPAQPFSVFHSTTCSSPHPGTAVKPCGRAAAVSLGCPCSLSRVTPSFPGVCQVSALHGLCCNCSGYAVETQAAWSLVIVPSVHLTSQSQPKDLRPEEAHTPGGDTAVCRGESPLVKCPELPGSHGPCSICCPPFILIANDLDITENSKLMKVRFPSSLPCSLLLRGVSGALCGRLEHRGWGEAHGESAQAPVRNAKGVRRGALQVPVTSV